MIPRYIGMTAMAVMAMALPTLAHAQDAPAAPETFDGKKLLETFGEIIEPENPTFQILGISADAITRPTAPIDVAYGIFNGLDQKGNFQSGLAMEFSPYLLINGRYLTNDRYQSSLGTRLLTAAQVTLGVAKGSSEADKSAKVSLGLVWTPINGADYYAKGPLSDCIKATFNDLPPPKLPQQSAEDYIRTVVEPFQARQTTAAKRCRADNPLTPYNTTTLQFSLAKLFASDSGRTDDFKSRGFYTTAVFGFGLTSTNALVRNKDAARGQLLFSTSYRQHEQVPDPDVKGAVVDRNRWNAGARLLYGRPDKMFINLQALYQQARYADARRDNYVTFVTGVDIRVSDNVWLSVSGGGSSGQSIGGNETFIGTGFKFGFGKKPEFAPSNMQAGDGK